jgi:hypothetical protein
MGFVIWYQLVVPGAGLGGLLPLRVSNDVFSGEYVLDADITVDLVPGAAASSFTAVLTNLPADAGETLKGAYDKAAKARKPLPVTISLGYFDEPAGRLKPVLTGAVTSVRTTVDQAGALVTELKGYEQAGYTLLTTRGAAHKAGSASLSAFAAELGKAGVSVDAGSELTAVPDFTVLADTAMGALRDIAEQAGAAVVIRDGTVLLGSRVGADGGASFSAEKNIVRLDKVQEDDPAVPPTPVGDLVTKPAGGGPGGGLADLAAGLLGAGGSGTKTSLSLVVLGDPGLRAGQKATLDPPEPAGPLRTERVSHVFSTRSGYTCAVTVAAAEPGKPAPPAPGAHRVAERVRTLAGGRPAIDVGEVTEYAKGHRATLAYGQSPKDGAVAPSVDTAVDPGVKLHEKPIASPFAYHKVGLMIPVLPGMRALLAHSGGSVNDAAVAGFLWPREPEYEPPANEPGDWWLCLPTKLGFDGKPTGKGVNDLTDAQGRRVVQAVGLTLSVDPTQRPAVGERPSVGPDGAFVVEGSAGTTVTVDDGGAVTVSTKGKDITFTNGLASITLSGGTVTISGTKVEVG